jgi:cysteine desulfurase family protein
MTQDNIIYLDHAATSWPKPDAVRQAVHDAMYQYGANPGRGAHRLARETGKAIYRTRMALAALFHIANPNDIAFTLNTSMALNIAIRGVVDQGDYVLYSGVEHNSVRRPIVQLEQNGIIQTGLIPCDETGVVRLDAFESQLKQSKAKVVVLTHASNVLGTILPIRALSQLAHAHGAIVIVDAAQTAGTVPIDVVDMGIDILAFPGHKGLLGPQGVGGLYVAPHVHVRPLLVGGTGSQSERISQPDVRPDCYETGTLNAPAIVGLRAGVEQVMAEGIAHIQQREWALSQQLMQGLSTMNGVRVLGPQIGEPRVGLVSFVVDGLSSAELAHRLDRDYNIAVRAGFHCAPLAHEQAGTTDSGAVRISVGHSTTASEIEQVLHAFMEIISKR